MASTAQLSDASDSTALGARRRRRCTTHRNASSGYSEPRPFAAKLQGATGREQVSRGPDGQFKALALFVLSLRVPETVGKPGRRDFVITHPFFLELNSLATFVIVVFASAETATAAVAIN